MFSAPSGRVNPRCGNLMSCAAVPGNSAAAFVTIALLTRAIIPCLGAVAGGSCTRAAAVGLRVQITYCRHDVGQGQLFPHLPQKQPKHMSRGGGGSFAMLSKRACCCCTVAVLFTPNQLAGVDPLQIVPLRKSKGAKKVRFKGKQPGSEQAGVTKHQKVKILGDIKTIRDFCSSPTTV